MTSTSITLLAKDADLLSDERGAIGLLFECAGDGAAARAHPQSARVDALVGDFEKTKASAYVLARKLLAGEPELRGVAQLNVFEQYVIRELQRAFELLTLHETLIARGAKQCRFDGDSPLASGLAWLVSHRGSVLKVTGEPPHGSTPRGLIARVWRRLSETGFSAGAVSREWRQAMERLDPYHRRERRKTAIERPQFGAAWFYTTAHTFTQIGLYYEPYFPQPFEYLVENPQTGGAPLRAGGRSWVSIYAFGLASMEPTSAEIEAARATILAHLNRPGLSPDEDVARRWLLRSGFMETFLARHLPSGLYASAMFARWADITRPAALVVGNPVFEAYALHAARSRGIPTVLLQHGVLGDFCQFSDPPVDHYVVRGEFWRDFLAAAPRARAHVLEPSRRTQSRPTSTRDAIVFLTAPYGLQPFAHLSDLDDILHTLLAVARSTERELIVRVHPLEDTAFYERKVAGLSAGDLRPPRVTFSRGPGLDDVLQRSIVAVTFCSTVFLDCLRLHIPVVSFGWHHFAYKRQIEAHGVFHFAEDLAGLSALVHRAVRGELPPYSQDTKPFLADTPEATLRSELARLIGVTTRPEAQPT